MTEKTIELKAASTDAATDPTLMDTARIERAENQEPPPSTPDVLDVDPGKLSRFVISYEMQQKMLQTKLPRLGPEYFLNTAPTNKAQQPPTASAAPTASAPPIASAAPTTPSQDSQPIPVVSKPHPPVGVVIVCLLGAVLLLGLAIVRSSKRTPEPKPVVPNETSTTQTSTPVVTSPAPEVVIPPPPVVSASPAEHAVQIAPTKGPTGHRIPAHPSSDPTPVSKPAQPDAAAVPTVSAAPTPTLPPHAAPVQSTWFEYK